MNVGGGCSRQGVGTQGLDPCIYIYIDVGAVQWIISVLKQWRSPAEQVLQLAAPEAENWPAQQRKDGGSDSQR